MKQIPVQFTEQGAVILGTDLGGGFHAYREPGSETLLIAYRADRTPTQPALATVEVPLDVLAKALAPPVTPAHEVDEPATEEGAAEEPQA